MYVLSNVASGNEFHKEAVMQQLFPQMGNDTQSIMIKLLQSNDGQLRMAAVWVVVNLTFPSSPSAYDQVVKLRNGSVISQLKNMVNDPCLDVKACIALSLSHSKHSGELAYLVGTTDQATKLAEAFSSGT
ncbi:hypothetical protein CsSME_00040174 [Camellia sinensis var. sinensis]